MRFQDLKSNKHTGKKFIIMFLTDKITTKTINKIYKDIL